MKKILETQGDSFDDLDREVWLNGEKLEIPEEDGEDAENDTPRR